MAKIEPRPGRFRHRRPGSARRLRTSLFSGGRRRHRTWQRSQYRIAGSLQSAVRATLRSIQPEQCGQMLCGGRAGRDSRDSERKLYPWLLGKTQLSKTIVDGDVPVEKSQRTNIEDKEGTLRFLARARKDITCQKPRRIRDLRERFPFSLMAKSHTMRMTAEILPGLYSLQRRNSSAPFVPPKPKEFDMAYSISALRAWFGTRSMPAVSGSGFSRLIVGGRIWSRRASTVMPASSPPAPPSKCPVMDLVELTAILRSPKKFLMACASSVSPMGVDVPWAFTYPTTSGVTPASRTALRMTRKPPSCSGAGCVMW